MTDNYDFLEMPLREPSKRLKLNKLMPEYGGREYRWAPVCLSSGAATDRLDRSLDTQKVPILIQPLKRNRDRSPTKDYF